VLAPLVFSVALAGLGVTVMRYTEGAVWYVGPILVTLAVAVVLMTLLHAQQQAVGRRLDAKRKPYRDPVTGQWIRYATIADLPESARNERLWQDKQMNRWFARQNETELEWLVNQTLRRGRLRRLWLKVTLPDRLRPPLSQVFVWTVLPQRARAALYACRRWWRRRRGDED
jgi:hypothetical protein